MTEPVEASGKCLCGATAVNVSIEAAKVDACHCSMCRRWGGGPLFAVGAGASVRLEGEDAVGIFASSDWAERGFCKYCGTHLFYRLKDGRHYALPAGLIDGDLDWEFTEQIFIDEKPSWYEFANETHDMTGAEVIAKFGES